MTSPLQQKIKITGPSVVTANRARDGIVIWRTKDGWSENLSEAAVVTDADTARTLLAQAVADDVGAIGAYIAPVQIEDGAIEPGNLRERIRRDGITIELLGTM
jgi:predicted NAD/FAD-binding protein